MNKFLVALCAIAFSFSSACADRMASKNVQAFEEGESEKPVKVQRGADTEDRSFGYWLRYGTEQEKKGRHDNAKEAFKKAVMLDPGSAEAHYRLGRAYRNLGNVKYAIRAFEEAVRIAPGMEEAYYSLATLYQELGSEKQALGAYQNVVRIDPHNAAAYYNLGQIYLSMHLKKEAKEAFLNAVKNKPDFAEAHYGLGTVYVMFNNIAAAIEEYKILVDLDRGLAYRLFGKIYE